MTTPEQAEANLLGTVSIALAELRGEDFRTRRRGIMMVAAVLGHRIGTEQLRDQPWGAVGQCENCGCIGKAPRDGDSLEGRALTTICPAARADLARRCQSDSTAP